VTHSIVVCYASDSIDTLKASERVGTEGKSVAVVGDIENTRRGRESFLTNELQCIDNSTEH
jgi:hypothetical protein